MGDERALDLDAKWRPLQLHTVAKAIRDSSKTVAQVEALNKLEPLVRCSFHCLTFSNMPSSRIFVVALSFRRCDILSFWVYAPSLDDVILL
jgi:hypothetical protein